MKHNISLIQHRLWINIATDDAGYLVLSNKLRRKQNSVLSNGAGLSAIRAQYRSLQQPEPQIIETSIDL